MGLKDLIITPIYLILFSVIAYFIRPYVTNAQTKKYFLPALWVRFAGAILLGVLYQFYYGGGDTFNYWEHGSKWIYEAFLENPKLGIQLLLEDGGQWSPDIFRYTSNIWYYRDPASYAIVKLTAFFDLLTFHTYSTTSLFFAMLSFSGLWAMYSSIEGKYPGNSGRLAIVVLFVPSVIFWGSGILKDTITLGAMGWITWSLLRWIEQGKRGFKEVTAFVISFLIVHKIKIYILICYLPMVLVWLFLRYIKRVEKVVLKILIIPILFILFSAVGFFALQEITEENEKYALYNLAERVRITAYDIRYGWGARTGGDGGYDIGLPDGSWQSMLVLIPKAINVSLFRPYIWEVKNPLMLLNALESLIVFYLTIQFLIKRRFNNIIKDPFLVFALGFSLVFAFAVGVSTFNFGTLMRYKIPLMTLFLSSIIVSSMLPKRYN